MRLTGDFETRSVCDLKKAGAYKYSLDLTTQPTCFAFKIKGEEKIWFLDFKMVSTPWRDLPSNLKKCWANFFNQGGLFSGHNAFFEICVYKNILVKRYGWPDIPFRQFRCTAAKAAACALPRSLAGAGEAMKLTTQKDKRGLIAMMATCRPTKQWNAWHKKKLIGEEPPKFLEPSDNPAIWNTLYEYCKIDVITEELLDKALPDLIPFEQEVWHLNQQLNWRGLLVDTPTVSKIVGIMETESKRKLKELDTLTMGLVTKAGARASILEFLKLEGIELPDIRANTVQDMLTNGKLTDDGRQLLEIRKALSKTSTKKYQAFINRAGSDNRIRDVLMYHGASTGRDTGTGIQPHNFPKGLIKISKERPYAAVENVIECDVETLKLLYGDDLSILFSSILRNMILPSHGCELWVADFAKIEVAVLWWLADNIPGLGVLNSGRDPYKYQAAANTGRRYDEIPDDGPERQLGKAQILGCGFGLGWAKFQLTAKTMYGLRLSDEQSKFAVKNYRETNAEVPKLWGKYEMAAIKAIEDKSSSVTINKCKFFCKDNFLWIQLPSNRRLAYPKPEVVWRQTEWSDNRKSIQFLGLAPGGKTLRTEISWGGVLVENVVQAVARDLMQYALLNLEKAGYKALLSVHDEVITERPIGDGNLEEFKSIMCQHPWWADSKLPIDAKAWRGERYRK